MTLFPDEREKVSPLLQSRKCTRPLNSTLFFCTLRGRNFLESSLFLFWCAERSNQALDGQQQRASAPKQNTNAPTRFLPAHFSRLFGQSARDIRRNDISSPLVPISFPTFFFFARCLFIRQGQKEEVENCLIFSPCRP